MALPPIDLLDSEATLDRTAVLVLAPRWGAGFVAAAALVAWSRMYLGSHYLSDVVAGAGLGTLVGAALALAIRRWMDARDAGKTQLTA